MWTVVANPPIALYADAFVKPKGLQVKQAIVHEQ
jgi:hypothetical protein